LLVATLILIRGMHVINRSIKNKQESVYLSRPAFCVSHPWLEALALSVETGVSLSSTSNGETVS